MILVIAGIVQLAGVMLANFVFIFLKAFQQRNVAHAHYSLIIPTTIAMAFAEVYVVSVIADHGFSIPMVLAVGLGGGIGALVSVWTHTKFVGRKKEKS